MTFVGGLTIPGIHGAKRFQRWWLCRCTPLLEQLHSQCTLTKVDLNLMSLDELMNRSTDAALRFNSQLYGTRLYLSTSNPDGADYTCTDGWVAISNATANLNSPLVVEALNNLFGIDPASGEDSFTKISDSLQALGQPQLHPLITSRRPCLSHFIMRRPLAVTRTYKTSAPL